MVVDIRDRIRGQRGTTLVIAVLLVLALPMPVVIGGVAADPTSIGTDTAIPDPLGAGQYSDQEIEGGETLIYDAELTDGAAFMVIAESQASDDVTVSITDPSGQSVGESFSGDGYDGVEVDEAPTTGTYTVEITNTGETVPFSLSVKHDDGTQQSQSDEVPDPLEDGVYIQQTIDTEEAISYEAELTAGDRFVVGAHFASDDDLEVTVTDPEGNPVGVDTSQARSNLVELREAPRDGTYLVTITNHGERTMFDLEVRLETDEEPESEPEPLETGTYDNIAIDAGETLTYEAEIATGDLFQALALSATEDLDVRITGPDGTPVGTAVPDPSLRGAIVVDAAAEGTYTIEITNTGDTGMTFTLSALHEPTVSLEPGSFEDRLESESFAYYVIDLAETDNLSIVIDAEQSGAIDPIVFDPEIKQTGETDRNDTHHRIELSDVETAGTYLVQLYNRAATVSYDLEVTHEGPGAITPGDDADGQTGDELGDSNAGNDSTTEDDSDESADDGSTDDAEDGVPGMDAKSALLALVAITMVAVSRLRTH